MKKQIFHKIDIFKLTLVFLFFVAGVFLLIKPDVSKAASPELVVEFDNTVYQVPFIYVQNGMSGAWWPPDSKSKVNLSWSLNQGPGWTPAVDIIRDGFKIASNVTGTNYTEKVWNDYNRSYSYKVVQHCNVALCGGRDQESNIVYFIADGFKGASATWKNNQEEIRWAAIKADRSLFFSMYYGFYHSVSNSVPTSLYNNQTMSNTEPKGMFTVALDANKPFYYSIFGGIYGFNNHPQFIYQNPAEPRSLTLTFTTGDTQTVPKFESFNAISSCKNNLPFVNLIWQASGTGNLYSIWRQEQNTDGSWTPFQEKYRNIVDKSFNDTDVVEGRAYHYFVEADNSMGFDYTTLAELTVQSCQQSSLSIDPKTSYMCVSDTKQFDSYLQVPDGTKTKVTNQSTWSVIGNIGSIDQNGKFSAISSMAGDTQRTGQVKTTYQNQSDLGYLTINDCGNVFSGLFVANSIEISRGGRAGLRIQYDPQVVNNPPPGFSNIIPPIWSEVTP